MVKNNGIYQFGINFNPGSVQKIPANVTKGAVDERFTTDDNNVNWFGRIGVDRFTNLGELLKKLVFDLVGSNGGNGGWLVLG